ncbi:MULTISPECIES: cytochrome o ubiquinol oxidase subunit IV [unclassified Cupriavidus]|uniref:cytochrome o ubiquinol oxidase subunit IV n=1 Tax=Cupriavidus sp. H19C3 TaxID=3241603 RepID=UPI003BF8836E
MSAYDEAADHGHGHDDDHDGAAHATLGGYVTGFVLSVILTAIPFWLVMGKVFDKSSTTALVLLGLGAVQIVVHMIYFLHMNARSEGGWTLLGLIFTLVLVVITLSGTLWVMFHLNSNMMPSMQHVQDTPVPGAVMPPKAP